MQTYIISVYQRNQHPANKDANCRDTLRPHVTSHLRKHFPFAHPCPFIVPPTATRIPSAKRSSLTRVAFATQDHEAALALVNARPSNTDVQQPNAAASETQEEDADLKRAKDLIDLHYAVKVKRKQGDDLGLEEVRESVERAMQRLEREDGKRRE